ncbi:hypothetical protein OUZ56_030567 [Daphnia magna]|uniref:Uncharacterized protein n=1 Tax=Daphnia magna TaxID=35525 RepID=A0ABQ9ZRP8_9CRUS|nr:hypothetical protein OUZ56_030567 [Daphnia magna]
MTGSRNFSLKIISRSIKAVNAIRIVHWIQVGNGYLRPQCPWGKDNVVTSATRQSEGNGLYQKLLNVNGLTLHQENDSQRLQPLWYINNIEASVENTPENTCHLQLYLHSCHSVLCIKVVVHELYAFIKKSRNTFYRNMGEHPKTVGFLLQRWAIRAIDLLRWIVRQPSMIQLGVRLRLSSLATAVGKGARRIESRNFNFHEGAAFEQDFDDSRVTVYIQSLPFVQLFSGTWLSLFRKASRVVSTLIILSIYKFFQLCCKNQASVHEGYAGTVRHQQILQRNHIQIIEQNLCSCDTSQTPMQFGMLVRLM